MDQPAAPRSIDKSGVVRELGGGATATESLAYAAFRARQAAIKRICNAALAAPTPGAAIHRPLVHDAARAGLYSLTVARGRLLRPRGRRSRQRCGVVVAHCQRRYGGHPQPSSGLAGAFGN